MCIDGQDTAPKNSGFIHPFDHDLSLEDKNPNLALPKMADSNTPKPSSSVKLVLLGEAAVGKVGFTIMVNHLVVLVLIFVILFNSLLWFFVL